MEDRARAGWPAGQRLPDADAWLLEQIRSGNAEAGHQFVREHYRAIYRYLLYLTEQPDLAADLTQETFLQAWRHLDTFQGRGSLRSWLHRIAHREFLDRLQRRPAELGLDGLAEVAAPDATAWMESVELRGVINRLPLEEREVLLLHHLEGYTSSEIASVVGVPARTVRLRLEQAREHLRQELGEDDLLYLNEPLAPMRQWAWLPLDQMHALETRLSRGGEGKEDTMERREFLRQATAGAVGLVLSEPGKEIVDGRLTQKVTLAFKATALSDLCDHLRTETGVYLSAGSSVADEKVTLFCKGMPLRDVMRQLSRPFGYAWTRSTRDGAYRYELIQDLRSQLLEEELRNRDRHAALLSLEKEIERYRPYLGLSPDEALARSKTASPAEKPLLENLGALGWGPIQMYYRLSRQELEALRAGQELTFSGEPKAGERLLLPEVARGVIQSWRHLRVRKDREFLLLYGGGAGEVRPEDLPLPAVPEVRASVNLWMKHTELGHLTLGGGSGILILGPGRSGEDSVGTYATGRNPSVLKVENRLFSGKWASDSALRPSVTLRPKPSCRAVLVASAGKVTLPEHKVTTADVLEALHQATGMPIVADYYTRLYPPADVSVRRQPVYEALNQLADAMHLRWAKEEAWLQFRSASYYDDRVKEVPNRLLSRWAAARRQRGFLSLDELVEIAQLPDAQLDAAEMAEGARECLGLAEWDLARHWRLRHHLRYLAGFTPEQRREAMSDAGLPFARMPLAQQQQQFLTHAATDHPLSGPFQSLEELAGATLRVEYTQPGQYQWGDPTLARYWNGWAVIVEPGKQGRWAPRPSLRGRSREAVLEALQRLDRRIRDAAVNSGRHPRPQPEPEPSLPLEAQIFPTELSLAFVYFPSATNTRLIHIVHSEGDSWQLLW